MQIKKWPEVTPLADMPGWAKKRRWSDFSTGQKIGVVVMGVIQFSLLAAGLWDLAHRKPEELRGDKRFWWGFMFVNWLGPIAYFAYGRKNGPLPFGRGKAADHITAPITNEENWEFGGPSVL